MTPETEAGIIAVALGVIIVAIVKIISDLSLKHPNGQYFSRMGTGYPSGSLRDLPTPTDAELAKATERFGGMTIEELAKKAEWCANQGVDPFAESSTPTEKTIKK